MQVFKNNKLISKNLSSNKITLLSNNVRLQLEFKISSNKEYGTNFDVYANFSPRGFYKNNKLSLEAKLSVLSIYDEFLDSLTNNTIPKNRDSINDEILAELSSAKRYWIKNTIGCAKNIFLKFRDFFNEMKCIPVLLKDIRALHIITYVDNEALVRSTIELDADIYNIISSNLEPKQYEKTFALHVCNMRYGQHLIQQRIRKFFDGIEPAAKFVGVLGSFVYLVLWIVFEMVNLRSDDFGTIALNGQNFDLLYILSSVFGDGGDAVKIYDTIVRITTQVFVMPFLILRFIPKISVRIIKKILF